MPAHKRLRHHKAKIQYLACEHTIFQMMAQGYSKRLIHEELTQKGSISMAYITLCQFIRRAKRKEPVSKATESPNKTPPASSVSGPRHISAPSNKFPNPRDMNPEDAI